MGATTWRGTVVIDGGLPVPAELTESVQVIDVSTSGPDTDPKWSMFDAAGHFHAVASDGTYPTLDRKSEHRDCDGRHGEEFDCDGYNVTVWDCRVCHERIEPGMIPGPHYRTMPGMRDWRLTYVADRPPTATDVSVQFVPTTDGQPALFGFAVVDDITVEGGPSGIRATVQLYGNGALGRIARPAPKPPEPDAPAVLEKFIADAQVALAKLRRTA